MRQTSTFITTVAVDKKYSDYFSTRLQRVDGYAMVDRIGCGGHGTVLRAVCLTTNKVVAVKEVRNTELAKLEATAMNDCQHQNVAVLDAQVTTRSATYLAMPLADHGSLFDAMGPHAGKGLGEYLCRGMFQQLVAGLKHMHAKGYVHRDLKPANILVYLKASAESARLVNFLFGKGSRHALTLKIADLGAATTKTCMGLAGTPGYWAPEVVEAANKTPQATYDGKKADIWCLGVILYEMLTGTRYMTVDDHKIQTPTEPQVFHARLEPFSKEVRNLITGMMICYPVIRPTLADIQKHAWITRTLAPKTQDEFLGCPVSSLYL